MTSARKALLIRSGVAVLASTGIVAAINFFIGREPLIEIDWVSRPVTFLRPEWFYLAALFPLLFVVRAYSLTDVSTTQQYTATVLRSLVLAALALAPAYALLFGLLLLPPWGSAIAYASLAPVALVIAALVYIRHEGNIRRLVSGTEPKIGSGKQKAGG